MGVHCTSVSVRTRSLSQAHTAGQHTVCFVFDEFPSRLQLLLINDIEVTRGPGTRTSPPRGRLGLGHKRGVVGCRRLAGINYWCKEEC